MSHQLPAHVLFKPLKRPFEAIPKIGRGLPPKEALGQSRIQDTPALFARARRSVPPEERLPGNLAQMAEEVVDRGLYPGPNV